MNTASKLFEEIENQGLLKKGKINFGKINKLSLSEILDFASKTREITLSENIEREKSAYAFSSSMSLSGGVYPCASLSCQLKKAKSLAQYAALYSDRVYIYYSPGEYLNHAEKLKSSEAENLQERLADDLSVLSYFRPLINAGKIIPITHPNYCPHCVAIKSFGNDADKRYHKSFTMLTKQYNKLMTVTIEKYGGEISLDVKAPEKLLEHGSACLFFEEEYPELNKFPDIIKRIENGETVTLSSEEVKILELDKDMATEVHQNLIFEMATTQTFDTHYLTDRNLDIDLLEKVSGRSIDYERNKIIQQYLTCLVPFLENVNPDDLIKISLPYI